MLLNEVLQIFFGLFEHADPFHRRVRSLTDEFIEGKLIQIAFQQAAAKLAYGLWRLRC